MLILVHQLIFQHIQDGHNGRRVLAQRQHDDGLQLAVSVPPHMQEPEKVSEFNCIFSV